MMVSKVKNQEKGAATLLVALILLIAVTLITFVAAQAVINEKRVSSNEIRAVKAFESAQAGLTAGVVYFRTGAALPSSSAAISGSPSSGASESYQYWFEEITGEDGKYELKSLGFSDDLSARRLLTIVVLTPPALPEFPENPVVTGGLLNATGNFDVTNESGNLTIWSGDAITLGGSAQTQIVGPSNSIVIGSNKDYRGGDIVDSDPNLASVSDADFERAFLGNTVSSLCTSPIDVNGKTNAEITAAMDAAGTYICLKDSSGGDIGVPSDIGTPPDGSGDGYSGKVVIIDGDYRQTSNTVISGLVYVTGDMTQGAGTPYVYGSLIVRGNVDLGNGTYSVVFNSSMAGGIGNESEAAGIPGTWRDWE